MLEINNEIRVSKRMIEDSSKYAISSRILLKHSGLGIVAQVNAALSIEISLKSFFSDVSDFKGTSYESYRFDKSLAELVKSAKDSHSLLMLAKSLPDYLSKRLITPYMWSTFENFGDTFVVDRYPYEEQKSRGYIGGLTDIAFELIERIIIVYKEQGVYTGGIERIINYEL